MDCPKCGRELPRLAALLAQTEVGTQCPRCWTRLRRLVPAPSVLKEKPSERRASPLRCAA